MFRLSEYFANGVDWAATGSFLAGFGTIVLAITALLTYRQWAHRESYSKDRERAIHILSRD